MIGGVLTEVGKRVSGRWLTAVLLPGLLLVAVTTTAVVLGHGHALDTDRLVAWAERTSRGPVAAPARLVITAALVAAAAGVTGTAAAGLGVLAQHLWMRRWFVTGGLLVRSRFSRRSRALRETERTGTPAVVAYLPQRPTWLGERVRLLEARIRAQYHVSASLIWPRLWLLLDDDARRPILDARTRYTEAVTLTGWGILYLVPGVLWWPALIIAGCVLLTGWRRARVALAEWTGLVEAAIDLRLTDLAAALGMPFAAATISAAEGHAIDDRLRKAGPA